jgi:hypothetical protein
VGNVTHQQADLLLKLYDLRREARLREACAWLMDEFKADSMEELQRLCPPGSREEKSFRMATTFWEMCASLVNRGLVNEDLYFENVRDQCGVWFRLEPVIAELRSTMKDPKFYWNLEEHARRYEVWAAQKRSPGAAQAVRDYWEGRRQFIVAAKVAAAREAAGKSAAEGAG